VAISLAGVAATNAPTRGRGGETGGRGGGGRGGSVGGGGGGGGDKLGRRCPRWWRRRWRRWRGRWRGRRMRRWCDGVSSGCIGGGGGRGGPRRGSNRVGGVSNWVAVEDSREDILDRGVRVGSRVARLLGWCGAHPVVGDGAGAKAFEVELCSCTTLVTLPASRMPSRWASGARRALITASVPADEAAGRPTNAPATLMTSTGWL
jgi:hypothetical protein